MHLVVLMVSRLLLEATPCGCLSTNCEKNVTRSILELYGLLSRTYQQFVLDE